MLSKAFLLLAVGGVLTACDVTAPPSISTATSSAAQAPDASSSTPSVVQIVNLTVEKSPEFFKLPIKAGGVCGFDEPKVERDARFFSGWGFIAAAPAQLAEAATIGITSNGVEKFARLTTVPREDVVKYFKNEMLKNSGFTVYIDRAEVPVGSKAVLYQKFSDKVYACAVNSGV
jgi:hypothetical protein